MFHTPYVNLLVVPHVLQRPKQRKKITVSSCSASLALMCDIRPVCLFPPGLSPAGALRGDPDPGRGGEAHHPEGQKPAPAPVWPARLRVRPPHPGGQPPSHSPPLQQLQCAVPEQLGRLGGACPDCVRLGVIGDA